MMEPTDRQLELLQRLREGDGGVVDQYGRLVIRGEIFPVETSTMALRMVAQGWIDGDKGRLTVTRSAPRYKGPISYTSFERRR